MLGVYFLTYLFFGILWFILHEVSATCVHFPEDEEDGFLAAYMFSLETQARLSTGISLLYLCLLLWRRQVYLVGSLCQKRSRGSLLAPFMYISRRTCTCQSTERVLDLPYALLQILGMHAGNHWVRVPSGGCVLVLSHCAHDTERDRHDIRRSRAWHHFCQAVAPQASGALHSHLRNCDHRPQRWPAQVHVPHS